MHSQSDGSVNVCFYNIQAVRILQNLVDIAKTHINYLYICR